MKEATSIYRIKDMDLGIRMALLYIFAAEEIFRDIYLGELRGQLLRFWSMEVWMTNGIARENVLLDTPLHAKRQFSCLYWLFRFIDHSRGQKSRNKY